jgi:hypothetical protein
MPKTRYVDVPEPTVGDLILAKRDSQWGILPAGAEGDSLILRNGLPIYAHGPTWQGAWDGDTAYVANDIVTSGGSTYIAILAHTNHQPPNATYWDVFAAGFSATTSAELAALIADETGSGALVFGTSPSLITPFIKGISGVASPHAGSAAEISGNISNAYLYLSDAGLTPHGMTAFLPTDVFMSIRNVSGSSGGINIRGLSSSDSFALYFQAFIGSSSPTLAPLTFTASKKSGASIQALAASEIVAQWANNGVAKLTMLGDGSLGLGTTAPGALLEEYFTDAVTAALTTLAILDHESSGTPAAGFGTRYLYRLKSSTTAAQDVGAIDVLWATATHASRKGRMVLSAFDDAAAREAFRLEASGSAAMVGFYGAPAVAQQTGVAVTAAAIHAALVNLGLITA